MFRGYRERLAELLTARFGGDPDVWRRAHDEAWVTYVQRVNAADWESRGYAEVVDDLDARHLVEMFDRAGVLAPLTDTLSVSRELEREAMARVNARYPDARTAIERLRAAGHKVYVATGGGETNDAALRGAGLTDLIDGIFTGIRRTRRKDNRGIGETSRSSSAPNPETVSSSTIVWITSRPRRRSEFWRSCWTGKARTAPRRCRRTCRRRCGTSRDSRTGSNFGPPLSVVESGRPPGGNGPARQ